MHANPILLRSLLGLVLVGSALACDDRTAEDKGRDYASEKLDFVSGAADVLKKQGQAVGEKTAHGVGNVLKGFGSGAKDVMYPPVEVRVPEGLAKTGVAVTRANEAEAQKGGERAVEVNLRFVSAFDGRLRLLAWDAQSKELGRSAACASLEEKAGDTELLTFAFPKSMRQSDVVHYTLERLPPLSVEVHPTLAAVRASQLGVEAYSVRFYVQNDKRFKGALQLRAYDESGAEIGRAATAEIELEDDGARFVTFDFDSATPMQDVHRFELRAL